MRDALIHAVIGAAFGMAAVYVTVMERDREINFLRGEYFAAHGLIKQAADTAEKSVDLAISLAAELTDAKREQTIERLTRYVAGVNPRVPASRIARALVVSAETHGLDVTWWAAQIEQESHLTHTQSVVQARQGWLRSCRLPRVLSGWIGASDSISRLAWRRERGICPGIYRLSDQSRGRNIDTAAVNQGTWSKSAIVARGSRLLRGFEYSR